MLKLNKENIQRYIINLTILIVTWGGMFRRSFNCDTLTHIANPQGDIMVRMRCERYLIAAIDYVLYHFFGVTTATHTGLTVFISILMFALALCFIQISFIEKVKLETVFEKIAFYAITTLVFINVLFGELLMFGECAVMFGLAYLFSAIGVYLFTKRKPFKALALFLLSTMCYQVAVVFGAIIISAWIFIDNNYKITLKTVKEEIVCGLVTFGSGVINMLSGEVLVKLGLIDWLMKGSGMGNFGEKLYKCGKNFLMLLYDSKGILPGVWLPLLIMLFSLGITIFIFIRKKTSVLYFCLLLPGFIFMLYAISIAQIDVYLPPRIIVPFYAIQSMLLLIAYHSAAGKLKQIVGWVSCGYLVIQMMFCNFEVANHMISNTLDRTYAMMVYEKIVDYEEETGIKVTKLGVINDIDCPFSYDSVVYKTDQINERALGTVTNTLVNVVSGRNFEKIPMDEQIFENYFKEKNWDYFDASKQLIIVEDAAYWAIF